MSKRRIGLVMMVVGILAVAAGIALGGYNLWDDHRAGLEAGSVLSVLIEHSKAAAAEHSAAPVPGGNNTVTGPGTDEEPLPESPPYAERELPVLEIDAHRYIGILSIPVIDVELPVQEDWSLALLKTAPCRYVGSPYQGDLIICAHNYATHFGRLKNLLPGDAVIFADVDGNEFRYTVAELETLAGTAVEEMESGAWDLTLFTCTLGGQTRVTVRCELQESDE